jgi:hypothetical protein
MQAPRGFFRCDPHLRPKNPIRWGVPLRSRLAVRKIDPSWSTRGGRDSGAVARPDRFAVSTGVKPDRFPPMGPPGREVDEAPRGLVAFLAYHPSP